MVILRGWFKKIIFQKKRLSKKQKKGWYFIITGLFLLGIVFFADLINFSSDYFSGFSDFSSSKKPEGIFPVELSVPRLATKVAVVKAVVEKGKWPTSSKAVSYLMGSDYLNKEGNVVIYGHNRKNLFGFLKNLKIDDILEVKGSDGKIYSFKVAKSFVVKPDKIEVLNWEEGYNLTLYTCEGIFDRQRLVIKARRISVRDL